jgi:hypothetical protein
MFVKEEGMFGVVFGKWMVGIDWGKGWSRWFVFVHDMNVGDDVWRSR